MQAMGVCVYSSKGCAAQEGQKFASSKELTFPEGLAFAKGNLYVARCLLLSLSATYLLKCMNQIRPAAAWLAEPCVHAA